MMLKKDGKDLLVAASCNNLTSQCRFGKHLKIEEIGRTQCRELPLCAGSGEGCQWQALPSPVQCEEIATRTRDVPVTGGKTLPLAPGPPFNIYNIKLVSLNSHEMCFDRAFI